MMNHVTVTDNCNKTDQKCATIRVLHSFMVVLILLAVLGVVLNYNLPISFELRTQHNEFYKHHALYRTIQISFSNLLLFSIPEYLRFDQHQRLQYNFNEQQQNQSKKSPVKVRIYIESLCIDSQRYMIEQVVPTYQALYGNHSIMDLQIIVFGNAHYSNDSKLYNSDTDTDRSDELICQHGIAECDANIYNLCVQTLYHHNIDRYLPFTMCLFDGRIPMGYHNVTYPKSIYANCAKETGIAWSYVMNQCYTNTTMVNTIQYNAYIETLVTNHTYVPWVTLNDVHLINEDEINLLHEILSRYYVDTIYYNN